MRTPAPLPTWRLAVSLAVVTAWLAGCEPKPAPAPESAPAPADAAPPMPAPSETAPPDAAPAAPVQPAPDAPPPTDSSPAPKPTSRDEPALGSMMLAKTNSKLGVPVDLRYRVDGEALDNQPVVVHLAAVPRVAGSNLQVSIKAVEGLQVSSGTISVQKTSAAAVYRQQYAVTRQASAPRELRVLVTMGVGEASAFSFFSVPLDGGNTAQKQDSVKQR